MYKGCRSVEEGRKWKGGGRSKKLSFEAQIAFATFSRMRGRQPATKIDNLT